MEIALILLAILAVGAILLFPSQQTVMTECGYILILAGIFCGWPLCIIGAVLLIAEHYKRD